MKTTQTDFGTVYRKTGCPRNIVDDTKSRSSVWHYAAHATQQGSSELRQSAITGRSPPLFHRLTHIAFTGLRPDMCNNTTPAKPGHGSNRKSEPRRVGRGWVSRRPCSTNTLSGGHHDRKIRKYPPHAARAARCSSRLARKAACLLANDATITPTVTIPIRMVLNALI